MERTTVLILSYHFAPSSVVGAKRFSFLARELERLGFDVRVVTATPRDSHHGNDADESLPVAGAVRSCRESLRLPLRGESAVSRLFNAFWRRLLAPVGREFFWTRAAARTGLQLAAGAHSGVVIATLPPSSAGLAGARLARRLGWPLILDYRDPWTAYPWRRMGRIGQWFAGRLEARLVEQSAARVLNTPAMREWFERYFPKVPTANNFVIPNGFDAPRPGSAVDPRQTNDGPLEIIHAGEIYSDRSLAPVLKALAIVLEKRPLPRGVRVVAYGDLRAAEKERIAAAGLTHLVEVRPKVPRETLFAHLQTAAVLLAISGDDMSYSVPYKMYDYLATGRPVLALASVGTALQRFVDDSGAGLFVDPADAAGLERALETLLFGAAPVAQPQAAQDYLWSNLARQYCVVIEAVGRPLTQPAAPLLTRSAGP